MHPPPVVMAHGIWNTGENFAALSRALGEAGHAQREAIDFAPNDGRVPIPELARQLDATVERWRTTSGEARIDLIGFSMGALVSRYWLQRMAGAARTRTFVSISGPHHGTLNAYVLPFAGTRDMRPGSALLRDLERDEDPWGDTTVHCFWTPFDAMIVPARSSVLAGAHHVQSFRVAMHRWMLDDGRVIRAVCDALAG